MQVPPNELAVPDGFSLPCLRPVCDCEPTNGAHAAVNAQQRPIHAGQTPASPSLSPINSPPFARHPSWKNIEILQARPVPIGKAPRPTSSPKSREKKKKQQQAKSKRRSTPIPPSTARIMIRRRRRRASLCHLVARPGPRQSHAAAQDEGCETAGRGPRRRRARRSTGSAPAAFPTSPMRARLVSRQDRPRGPGAGCRTGGGKDAMRCDAQG